MRHGGKQLDGGTEADHEFGKWQGREFNASGPVCVSAYPLPTMHERGAVMRMARDR